MKKALPHFKPLPPSALLQGAPEQLQSISEKIRQSYLQNLERHLQAVCDERAGQPLTPEEHAQSHRLLAHLAPDRRLTLYTYDGNPLLLVEHWPDPGSTDHISCVAKFTRLPPDAPFPFLIQPN